MSVTVEIAVQDEEGLVVAAHAGADRVELCADLDHGGSTPAPERVAACVDRASALLASRDARPQFGVHVLVRPASTATSFLGEPELFALAPGQVDRMAADASAAIEAGAAGVVVGALRRGPGGDWELDTGALEAVRDAALVAGSRSLRGVSVSCDRCVDALPDAGARLRAVAELVRLGFARVLTSGGAARALDGVEDIGRMVEAADGIVDVCAGGGVRPADIVPLVRAAGVADIHLSGRLPSGSRTDPAVCAAAVDAAGAL